MISSVHLFHPMDETAGQTEEKNLKEAESSYDDMERRVTELESRRDFLLQQKQSEIEESEKADKLKEDNKHMVVDLLQSTSEVKREFAKK